jgi:hypothetical protein
MNNRTTTGASCVKTWLSTLGALISLFAFPAVAAEPAVNTISGIRAVESGVEIELHSSRPFPVRNQITVLRIGDKEFTKSRYPKDGNLDTLIFKLTSDEFGQLANGDPVRVQYGRGVTADYWDFGTLDKRRLAR